MLGDETLDPAEGLRMALALPADEENHQDYLYQGLLEAQPDAFDVIKNFVQSFSGAAPCSR